MTDIDPEVAAFLDGLPPGAFDFGAWALEEIPAERAARAASAPAPTLPATTTVHRDLTEPVGMRVYAPPGGEAGRPCLLWMHGGGYFMGSALLVEPRLQRWVEQLDCVVVAVDYRLAPEHPYPAALDDCWAALTWCFDVLGAEEVVLGGISAGGGLTAALALLARDRGEQRVAAQLLMAPMLDDREITPSRQVEGTPVWDRRANRLGWRAYLGGVDGVPPYAAPARATDLAGLPPAFVAVGSVDLFCDECIEYATRLLQAGVPTELHVYAGGPHGFDVLTPSALARRANRDLDDALDQALRPRRPASQPRAR